MHVFSTLHHHHLYDVNKRKTIVYITLSWMIKIVLWAIFKPPQFSYSQTQPSLLRIITITNFFIIIITDTILCRASKVLPIFQPTIAIKIIIIFHINFIIIDNNHRHDYYDIMTSWYHDRYNIFQGELRHPGLVRSPTHDRHHGHFKHLTHLPGHVRTFTIVIYHICIYIYLTPRWDVSLYSLFIWSNTFKNHDIMFFAFSIFSFPWQVNLLWMMIFSLSLSTFHILSTYQIISSQCFCT